MTKAPRKKRAGASPAAASMADWPASRVEIWPMDRIVPYPGNPKSHPDSQIELIATSMREDGVTAPILVDEAGVIVAGHGRRLAALKNGYEAYPVVQAHGWSEQQKRAIRIKDNSFAALSPWNTELMKAELIDLKSAGYALPMLGMPEAQLRSFGVSLGGEPLIDPDQTPPPPAAPVSRAGDVWLMMNHRLLCGSSTNAKDVERIVRDEKLRLMVTDPPYGVEYRPEWRATPKVGRQAPAEFASNGKVTNDHRSAWDEAWKLFPGDVAYVWCAAKTCDEAIQSLERVGLMRRAEIIWRKSQFIIGQGDYHWQHENCWYVVRSGRKSGWNGSRNQSSVWDINSRSGFLSKKEGPDARTGHGTQKPVECMKRPIENNSRHGDAVYEPFCGSGTTIIAAELAGRNCIAIEIDPAYVDVAVMRWERVSGQKAILDGGGGKTFEQVRKTRLGAARAPKAREKQAHA